jgi:hypothetical protein
LRLYHWIRFMLYCLLKIRLILFPVFRAVDVAKQAIGGC